MRTFDLEGALRTDLGKKASKSLRSKDLVPCVIYGGEATTNFTVTQDSVRKLIYSPEVFLVNLTLMGKQISCIIKELQFHPVTDQLIHIDFLEVSDKKPIEIEIPVELTGHAAGVRAGGKLSLSMRKIRVRAMYDQVPEHLKIDVTKMTLGKSIQVKDLHFEGLELTSSPYAVVCSVKLTRAARGMASSAVEIEEDEAQEGESEETAAE